MAVSVVLMRHIQMCEVGLKTWRRNRLCRLRRQLQWGAGVVSIDGRTEIRVFNRSGLIWRDGAAAGAMDVGGILQCAVLAYIRGGVALHRKVLVDAVNDVRWLSIQSWAEVWSTFCMRRQAQGAVRGRGDCKGSWRTSQRF